MTKRILHVIPSLMSGGAERQLANLVSNSSASEFTHIVCAFKDADFFAPEIRKSGHVVHQLNIVGKHPWFSGAKKLISAVDKHKPDIIKTWLFDANIVGRLARMWNFKIPLITTLHSPDYDPDTIRAGNWSPMKTEGLRQIDMMTTRLTRSHFIAVSNYVRKSYIKYAKVKESNISVIYNGIDPNSIKSTYDEARQLRQNLNIPKEAFIYITVGRLDAAKNHGLLLEVFSKVLASVPNAYLVIVGTGPLEKQLQDESNKMEINNRVRFMGKRSDIGVCLEMSDAFVFPTLFEGFGIALVEAMFKKLPCISSDLEVLRELVTDNETALLFDPRNRRQLLDNMITVASQPELGKKLADRAFTEAQRRFHITVAVEKWENYYRALLSKAAHN